MTTTADWNPALYARFEDERTRPAAELLARVALTAPREVVDLGCGPGNSTELLRARWPAAHVVGIDTSPAMLEAARQRLPDVPFVAGDAGTWTPPVPVDVIFANAVLQWIPGHEQLLPRLVSLLAPGGVLAVQMPDNLDEPSHVAMRETAADPRFSAWLGDASRIRARLLDVPGYHDLLSPTCEVDAWRTTYHHRMADAQAIVEWVRATGLKPFLEPLPPEARAEFLAAYTRRIDAAYGVRADGGRLLAFPRLFLVARRR